MEVAVFLRRKVPADSFYEGQLSLKLIAVFVKPPIVVIRIYLKNIFGRYSLPPLFLLRADKDTFFKRNNTIISLKNT